MASHWTVPFCSRNTEKGRERERRGEREREGEGNVSEKGMEWGTRQRRESRAEASKTEIVAERLTCRREFRRSLRFY